MDRVHIRRQFVAATLRPSDQVSLRIQVEQQNLSTARRSFGREMQG